MREIAGSGQGRADALAWLASSVRTRETDRQVAPYVDAAAMLSTFKLETIQPVGSGCELERTEALIELTSRSRPVGEPVLDTWQLEESVRAEALRRLADRTAMRRARAANPGPASDPVQEGIDRLINEKELPHLDELSLDQLLGVERAAQWLEGIISLLPSRSDLAARIERERQLAPMRRLAGEGFVDRESYLGQLADYVGALPPETVWQRLRRGFKYVAYSIDERPPLHLYGPGGVGKSALLARFILDHANPRHPQPLPFVYLDFDRAALNPRQPQTILEDAIRQLLIQFPGVNAELVALGDEARENVARLEAVEVAKSGQFEARDNLIRRFCRLLEVIAERNDQPVLIVLDTLEEVEYQGQSAMIVTWGLLSDLLKKVDRLRVVTAGRSALPPGLPREPVELTGLSEEAAVQLVIQRAAELPGGPVSPEDARTIISLVGTVPLSLVLAARVVVSEGIAGLRSTVGRRRLFSRIKAEQHQGILYRRILSHVRAHNPELEKVVDPGLILRRITPDIIEHVLAEPCQLRLRDSQHAQRLFDELGREVGLVDPYREAGALWHLPAVRRIMLPELRGTLGSIARVIHESAARYYQGRPSAIERAEEIYHRLWLRADASELDRLWRPDLEPHLRGAYEELEPLGKIWLGDRLGIELEEGLRAQADFAIWERQAEQRARTLMSSGLVAEALDALRERPRSERPSPLYALEADALKLLGRLDEAKATVSAGLAAAERAGDRGAMLPLVLRGVFLQEAAGELEEALSHAKHALDLARRLHEPLDVLSAGTAVLRLVRKRTAGGWTDATEAEARTAGRLVEDLAMDFFLKELRADLLGLLDHGEVRSLLRSRPALLLEAAAELGNDRIELLVEAISLLGISLDDRLALSRYAQQSGTPLSKSQRKLLAQLEHGVTSRGVGQKVAELVPAFSDFFVRRLAQSVEDSLHRTVNPPSGAKPQAEPTGLSAAEMDTLEGLVVRSFTPQEIELLTLDSFDVHLKDVVDQSAPFDSQVRRLFNYATKHGSFGKFVTHLARSRPDDQELNQFVPRLDLNAAKITDQPMETKSSSLLRRQRTFGVPHPVVFVPGITASELRDEYPVDFETVWAVVTKDYARVALHPDDPRYEAVQPSRVVVGRVFRLVYGEFIEELRHNLSPRPTAPVPVFPFGYDWRQPLEVTARRLAGFVEEVAARTALMPHYYKAGYADAPKVNLVGHSMGGLVIAEYLAQAKSGHQAAKIATLGSPFRGSHEAVLKVVTGTADLGTNRSSSRERETARVTPALYHLIPCYAGAVAADPGLKTDLFDPDAWQPAVLQSIEQYVRLYGRTNGSPGDRARALFAEMLRQAREQRQRMENLKLADAGLAEDDWLAIIGVGEDTRFRLHIEDNRGRPWFDLASKDRVNTWKPDAWRDQVNTGDGTVPYLGAQAAFLKTEKLVCVCDDDFGYWELKDRLLEGIATGLHATLPLMNLVQRLVVSHFLGKEYGQVWGRPAPDIGTAKWSPPVQKLRMKEG